MPDPNALTERQQAWFASLREGLERDTGRAVAEWAEIARACPETKPRARLAWMKAEHGLGQNRASLVLNAAFPSDTNWSTPEVVGDALWRDPGARAIYEAIRARVVALPEVVIGQRKAFTAFSRGFQFAAMRPVGGAVVLGLAIDPTAFPMLRATKRAAWSERLTAEIQLASDPGAALDEPIRAAWERS